MSDCDGEKGFIVSRFQDGIEDPLPPLGLDYKGRLVRLFERDIHIDFGFEKEGHLRKGVADGDRFNESTGSQSAFVRDQRECLVGGQLERFGFRLIPDLSMYTLRIAPPRWKRI